MAGLEKMKAEDLVNKDYIPYLRDSNLKRQTGIVELSDGVFAGNI